MYRKTLSSAVSLTALVSFACVPLSAQFYMLTDLGVPAGFATSTAVDVNNLGHVAVNASNGAATGAYYYAGGPLVSIPNLGGTTRNEVLGLNNLDQFVGAAFSGPTAQGYSFDAGTNSLVARNYALPGSNNFARQINNSGQILGGATTFGAGSWVFSGGSAYDVDTAAGLLTLAHDLNNNGLLLGYNGTAAQYFVWDANPPTSPGPDFLSSTVLGDGFRTLNDNGLIAGANGTSLRLFDLASGLNGPVVSLGTLGTGIVAANDIGNNGQIVGNFLAGPGSMRAYAYVGTSLFDLNTAIDPALGWVLETANGVNELGQIVGGGFTPTGAYHAYLLTPVAVPEPSTWGVLAAIVLACLCWRRWRSIRN